MTNKKNPCITINTDASWDPKEKIGGYAFWIKCDSFTIKTSGQFKTKPTSSIKAELMCIANAVYTLCELPELPHTSLIVINCDCLMAFDRIYLNSSCKIGKMIALKLEELKTKTSPQGVTKVDLRHVKAHSGILNARSFVNNWCDKAAKEEMRRQRKRPSVP